GPLPLLTSLEASREGEVSRAVIHRAAGERRILAVRVRDRYGKKRLLLTRESWEAWLQEYRRNLPSPGLLSLREAARLVGCSSGWLRVAAASGRLEAFRCQNGYRVSRTALAQWLAGTRTVVEAGLAESLTVPEAAERAGLAPERLMRKILASELLAQRSIQGEHLEIRVSRPELERWLRNRDVLGQAKHPVQRCLLAILLRRRETQGLDPALHELHRLVIQDYPVHVREVAAHLAWLRRHGLLVPPELPDRLPPELATLAGVARRLGMRRRGVSLLGLHWAVCLALPEQDLGLTALTRLVRLHTINEPARLRLDAWTRHPLFQRVGRGFYRLLRVPELALFRSLVDQGDPRVYLPRYRADALFGAPARVRGGRLPPPELRTPSRQDLIRAAEALGPDFRAESLLKELGLSISRRAVASLRWFLYRHTVNVPGRKRHPGRKEAWRARPLFYCGQKGRFNLLSGEQMRAFRELLRRGDPRLEQPRYDLGEVLGRLTR
ncbi:MAG: helix-turn-helix domain-containing protein, partial [Candidatus Eremiobacterota bacterium]